MKIVKLNESNNPIKYYISIGRNPGTILLNAVLFRTKGKQLVCRSVDTITNLLKTINITNGLVDGESLTGIEPYQASELRFAADFDSLEEAKQFILCWAKIQRFYFDIHFNFANNAEESDAAIYENYTIVGIDQNTNEIVSNYIITRDDLYDKPLKRSAGFVKKSREINEDVNPNIYYVLCVDQNRVDAWSVVDGLILRAPKPNQDENAVKQVVTTKCTTYNEFIQLERALDKGIITPINTVSIDYSNELVRKGQDLTTALIFDNKEFAIDVFRALAKAYLTIYSFSKDVKQNLLDDFFIGEWDNNLKMGVNAYKLTEADIDGGPRTFARSTGFVKKGSSRESN